MVNEYIEKNNVED